PLADELDLQARGQLRRRDHPAHGDLEGPVLSVDGQEHAFDEGDASARPAGERAAQPLPEGPAGAPARNAGALPQAQGESNGRLPADGGAGADLLCALSRPVGVGRAPERGVPLLRAFLRRRPLDLRPGRARSDLRATDPDGHHYVRAAEADTNYG